MYILIVVIVTISSVLTYTSFKLINDKLDDMINNEIVNLKGDDDYDY